jgi:hypothetical protein
MTSAKVKLLATAVAVPRDTNSPKSSITASIFLISPSGRTSPTPAVKIDTHFLRNIAGTFRIFASEQRDSLAEIGAIG